MDIALMVTSLAFPAVACFLLELALGALPLAGPELARIPRWIRQQYVKILLWLPKKLWGLAGKGAKKSASTAVKWLFSAAWRGVKITLRAIWAFIRKAP